MPVRTAKKMVKDTLNNMSTIAKENLDERIERIKKRNEEIEKKHREAEEDRLRALKENAMVETKPPKDDDWPRTHKYDKIDFMYDVKPGKIEDANNQKLEEKKLKRDYKKFPEGEGPPPDPAYNFLADAERDGLIIQKPDKPGGKDKDSKQNMNNKNNKDQQQKRGGPNGGSFRGRGGKISPKYQKQNSQPEYEQWRSEREKIDEARISRQKVGEGKWRREWDNDKQNSENEALLRAERATLGDAINAAKKSPTHQHANVQEKRGNITVSVSQTGEVKSVKLTSAPAIGTGRVGPRQVSKPQFSIQAVEKEVTITKAPHSPKLHQKATQRPINNSNNGPQNRNIRRDTAPPVNANQCFAGQPANAPKSAKPYKPKSPKFVPKGTAVVIPPASAIIRSPLIADLTLADAELIAVDLSHKPEFARKSVQDRLIRIRQANNSGGEVTSPAKNENTSARDSENSSDQSSIVPPQINSTERTDNVESCKEIQPTKDDSETKSATGEDSNQTEKSINVEEQCIESNTNNCDSDTVSSKVIESNGEAEKTSCDANSNDVVAVAVASTPEAIAAN